ncbi:hypothetical protein BO71DRAFT_177999 [Aspergillus ellipticus CBS 707.79]|uniref:Secreted protein n=1 Tax=Aspergillus ellipticus CBS 707.79 TaxID=1448320 RepID=A0A319DFV4_9EURO|nr:hypothetical protein BO71DRAFT_177999 [Aspergillus ellipticus CBS 707.79]
MTRAGFLLCPVRLLAGRTLSMHVKLTWGGAGPGSERLPGTWGLVGDSESRAKRYPSVDRLMLWKADDVRDSGVTLGCTYLLGKLP